MPVDYPQETTRAPVSTQHARKIAAAFGFCAGLACLWFLGTFVNLGTALS